MGDTPKLGALLTDARTLLTETRQAEYGNPRPNYICAARIATEMTGIGLTERDIYLVMAAVKLARNAGQHKRDNLLDAVAYLAMADYAVEDDASELPEPIRGRIMEGMTDGASA